jgi:hypothetical protein
MMHYRSFSGVVALTTGLAAVLDDAVSTHDTHQIESARRFPSNAAAMVRSLS